MNAIFTASAYDWNLRTQRIESATKRYEKAKRANIRAWETHRSAKQLGEDNDKALETYRAECAAAESALQATAL